MFSGIIETVGHVARCETQGERIRLEIDAPELEGLRLGDSVAVNGTCLTVVAVEGGRIAFDAVPETLARTAMRHVESGDRVNLERALRVGDRLDGHIVQGHVDATGRVHSLTREDDDVRLAVDCGPDFAAQLVDKGSVAIDGVALTIAGLRDGGFDVVLIPYTLKETTLGGLRSDDAVNLEADVLGKYVQRHVERILGDR